jgi:hypothetical protein
MQTYIESTGMVWQFEDDVVVSGTPGALIFTAAHGAVLNTPASLAPYTIPTPTVEQLAAAQQSAAWLAYQNQAKAALDASDVTILRCVEKLIVVPTEWATYRASLRTIVGATSVGDPTQLLPTRPAYPSGT